MYPPLYLRTFTVWCFGYGELVPLLACQFFPDAVACVCVKGTDEQEPFGNGP
jgi:hypothetical protein